jgi:hypothetical protein
MSPTEWTGIALSIISLVAAFATLVRWLVKHYLAELKPNGGESLRDKVNLLDEKVELLTDLVKEALRK